MAQLKYQINQLPGEAQYRQFLNQLEESFQQSYREYQEFRMNIGLSMNDIDAIVSDQIEESFNKMRNIEYERIGNKINVYAILEMKHFRTQDHIIQRLIEEPSANQELANLADRPFFVVKYFPATENNNVWEFSVYPANLQARNILKYSTHMSERRFIKFMYEDLRHQVVPANLLEKSCPQKNMNHFNPL